MDKSEVHNISFQIIGYAGDAFSSFHEALAKARQGDFVGADALIEAGNKELGKAHQAQTGLLVEEANGNDIAFSVILVHAQDHLMTTIMYERIAKEFINMYKEKIIE